jgi:hypothetical protein
MNDLSNMGPLNYFGTFLSQQDQPLICRGTFGRTTGAVDCIAEGWATTQRYWMTFHAVLGDGVSSFSANSWLWERRRYRNALALKSITSTGVGVLLETMEQNSQRITDLDLTHNPLGRGASL